MADQADSQDWDTIKREMMFTQSNLYASLSLSTLNGNVFLDPCHLRGDLICAEQRRRMTSFKKVTLLKLILLGDFAYQRIVDTEQGINEAG